MGCQRAESFGIDAPDGAGVPSNHHSSATRTRNQQGSLEVHWTCRQPMHKLRLPQI